MDEIIDEYLSYDILVNIKDLNFMILYFKFSNLLFFFGLFIFVFNSTVIACYT